MKKESNKNWTTCLRLNTGDGSPRVFLLNSHFLGSVPNKFLTPFNSHLIRFPITAIIESEIFPNIRPQGERINKKVNPFLNKRVRQVCMPRSLARGRENRECVLDKTKSIKCVLGRKKGKEKTDEGSSVLLYFMTEEGERE